jgi:hypothetical protein
MTTDSKPAALVRTQLRIPKQLHNTLTDAAARNGRSLNAEILSRLQVSPVLDGIEELKRQNTELRDIARRILDSVQD